MLTFQLSTFNLSTFCTQSHANGLESPSAHESPERDCSHGVPIYANSLKLNASLPYGIIPLHVVETARIIDILWV